MKQIENDNKGNQRIQFFAKLLSISEKTLENVNKTEYKVCSVEFEDAAGNTQHSSGIMYMGNFEHGVKVGEKYLAVATLFEPTEAYPQGSVLIQVSHLLANADRPSLDMFLGALATEAATVGAEKGVLKS